MQERNVYEREIDLVQLIKYLWKRMWVMVIGGVVGLVLVLGLQMITHNDSESNEDTQELTAFEKQLKAYEEDYAQLEMEITNLEKSIEEQIAYNNDSILMKVNPYDKKSVSGQYYIDSGYEIMPELTYQNRDITSSVTRAYQSLATTGELATYINEHLQNPIKERYLNELISVSYSGDSVLDVKVVHTDIDSARELYQLIIEYMGKKQGEFQKHIGTYTITLLNESENASVDLALKESQVANIDSINTLKETLTKKQTEFESLVMPTQGISLKLPVIGAFLGGFGVAAVLVVLFLIDTTLKTEQDIALMLELPVLGAIPVIEEDKKEVRKGKRNKKSRYMQYVGR